MTAAERAVAEAMLAAVQAKVDRLDVRIGELRADLDAYRAACPSTVGGAR